jgi:DNA modification methylase
MPDPTLVPPTVLHLGATTLIHDNAVNALRAMGENSVDAIVTDPPYGLSKEPDAAEVLAHWLAGDDYVHQGNGFMGNSWDSFVPGPTVWREAFRVLKPGGHVLSFSSTRTYDLMVIAMRLAGFEVRDTIHWTFATGMPKSVDIEKALTKAGEPDLAGRFSGYGTALKPSHELIAMVRKPLEQKIITTVATYGTGGLNIGECRVQAPRGDSDPTRSGEESATRRYNTTGGTNFAATPGPRGGSPEGRFPMNTLLTHSPDCTELGHLETGEGEERAQVAVFDCTADCPVAVMDAQSGIRVSGKPGVHRGTPNNSAAYGAESRKAGHSMVGYGDSGGASRFFPKFKYSNKATSSERAVVYVPAPGCRPVGSAMNCGIDPHDPATGFADAATPEPSDCASCGEPRVPYQHATVKPVALMAWLVRLVTPPNGVVMDFFAGTGTTGVAANEAGFDNILVERDPAHVAMIHKRVRVGTQGALFDAS